MNRRFLFLQGPHGPFFAALARSLMVAGAEVGRIGFTLGDRVFWHGLPGFEKFEGTPDEWANALRARIEQDGISDLVCYGASRPIHREARSLAAELGVTVHVFEEGYLRPYWITYERGGTNAESRLMRIDTDHMRHALDVIRTPLRPAPDRWGAMRQHMFWGAIYHGLLLAGARRYPGFRPHRAPDPGGEFLLYLKRFFSLPLHRWQRGVATWRVRHGSFPYHVVLMQLAHDANFRDHSSIPSQEAFLRQVMSAFAEAAPQHHHLVLKAHPLEDGREPLRPLMKRLTREFALTGRVHLITGGKLARLLDRAESAVTVNSTSAEQALWRGLPLKALGQAIFDRPEFASNQPLDAFFKAPKPPDHQAYLVYRHYLLHTSQVSGGFYSRQGRKAALRRLPDMMLAQCDPYDAFEKRAASTQQQIRIVA